MPTTQAILFKFCRQVCSYSSHVRIVFGSTINLELPEIGGISIC